MGVPETNVEDSTPNTASTVITLSSEGLSRFVLNVDFKKEDEDLDKVPCSDK
jgi:hypothetical protein